MKRTHSPRRLVDAIEPVSFVESFFIDPDDSIDCGSVLVKSLDAVKIRLDESSARKDPGFVGSMYIVCGCLEKLERCRRLRH